MVSRRAGGPTIAALATAVPEPVDQAALWQDVFAARYGGSLRAAGLWASAGVTTRHAVVDPRTEDVSGWGTGARMERYLIEALPLVERAVAAALDEAQLSAAEVDLLAVASCTGYATPGLDLLTAHGLGMSEHLQRLLVGHMGCYAAIPGLGAVADATAARGLVSVLACVELPSLHVQPATEQAQQVITHALFSDAAAAVVLRPGGVGLEVIDIAARTDLGHLGAMTWDVTDHGFEMGLSPQVPRVLRRHVGPLVDHLLGRNGLSRPDVAGWAIHPGGPRILDVCAERLGLDEAALGPSRSTLRDHGNCSSATLLLVLDELCRARPPAVGEHVVALGFGPGLTLYGALLRQGGPERP